MAQVAMESVGETVVVPKAPPQMLASRGSRPTDTVVEVAGVKVGGPDFVVIAGPCSVESDAQLFTTAQAVKRAGAALLRGGAYKPRTSPYSFQGLGEEGLRLLAKARELTGLPVVTELMDAEELPLFQLYADVIQIGARNVQNFSLLKKVARAKKPVLLKRGLMTTVEELLLAAEYLLAGGNSQVILCERGIRTFETATRNTLDLGAVCVLKEPPLPVSVTPPRGARASWPPGRPLGGGRPGSWWSPPRPGKGLVHDCQRSTRLFQALMAEL